MKKLVLLMLLFYSSVLFADINRDLAAAVSSNNVDDVIRLIKQGADVNWKSTSKELSILIHASRNSWNSNDPRIVKLLLENGADVNDQQNVLAWTALFIATKGRNLEVIKLLIDKGADVNAKDREGNPVIFGITSFTTQDEKEYGIKKAKLLLDKGADINMRNNDGKTVLMSVTNKELAEFLLSKGLDVNAKDNNGLTAYSCVPQEILPILKKYGIKPTKEDIKERQQNR